MKNKRVLLTIVVAALLCLSALWACPLTTWLFPNIGLPVGYYGQFNRVKWRLNRVAGIRILGYHQHKDLSLEDFWFYLQTEDGLKFDLKFSHVAKTYELFEKADGLAVQQRDSGKWLLYPFGPGGLLETATSKEMRHAVDVLKNFDKIAEVVESDRRKEQPQVEPQRVPNNYVQIILPSYFLPLAE
ncbi:MAG: hypothetical protein JSU70_17395 [Phycisphaerales bacterium]|nr:MAG: hypothetical protein JSU70_17395 [Phycisphaerales bacterium]